MRYVVAKIGGKQYRLEEGRVYQADRFDGKINEVLLAVEDDKVSIGEPVLEDYPVVVSKLEDKKGKKVVIRRYKAKSRYRRLKGHRQPITIFKVESLGTVSKVEKEKPSKAEGKTKAVPRSKKIPNS